MNYYIIIIVREGQTTTLQNTTYIIGGKNIMANTLTIQTGHNKLITAIFNKVVNGKELTPKQETQLQNFLADFKEQEQPTKEQPKEDTTPIKEELSLGNWKTLTAEQRDTLKETLIKSVYGIGGEHLSTFPTLLDNKINPWVEQEYKISLLPKRVQEQTFTEWAGNGEIKILPLEKGKHIQYLILFLPNKEITLDLWELEKEDKKPFLQYTKHNKAGQITLGKNHFHILNIYSNKNKAFNQAKQLTKLFQYTGTKDTLEAQKELQLGYLSMDIQDGEQVLREYTKAMNVGGTYTTLGEYLGREQHQDITINYLEQIQ